MTTYSVSTAAELQAAMLKVAGGDTVVLAPGNYGSLDLWFKTMNPALTSTVTIKPSGKVGSAVLEALSVSGVRNLKFQGLGFLYTPLSGEPSWTRKFTVEKCENITIQNCAFKGGPALGQPDPAYEGQANGIGLGVIGCNGVKVTRNTFQTFHRGATFGQTRNLEVSYNDIWDMSSDGIDFAEVQTVLIKGNKIHDFSKPPNSDAHPDFIQFWTSGTENPSTDVLICDNYLDAGDGVWAQSIFMRNEVVDQGLRGDDMLYRNFRIRNNFIRNGHSHGITMGECDGLEIDGNTLMQVDRFLVNGEVAVPKINVAAKCRNVAIQDNVMPRPLVNMQPGWTIANNIVVQMDRYKLPDFIGNQFRNPFSTAIAQADMRPHPEGFVQSSGAGTDLSKDWTITPLAMVRDEQTAHLTKTFQAGLYNKAGAVDLSQATIKWNFGDKTTGTGLKASHTYAKPGAYTVKATVTVGGRSYTAYKRVKVYDLRYLTETGSVKVTPGVAPKAYPLSVDAFDNTDLTVKVRLAKDTADAGGWLVYCSGNLYLSVGPSGIEFQVVTNDNQVMKTKSTVGIKDTAEHEIVALFSTTLGVMSIWLDNQLLITSTVPLGLRQAKGPNTFHLGSPFNGTLPCTVTGFSYAGEYQAP